MSIEDKAQEHEAAEWERINVSRPRLPPMKKPGEPGYGPEECDDCGGPMPDLRRANGWRLCTACQSVVERRVFR